MTALLAIVLAASAADVAQGVDQYDVGEFAKARYALTALVDAPDLPPAELARARLYFAASAYALKDSEASHAALVKLFTAAPETQIDSSVFVPEFVSFAD